MTTAEKRRHFKLNYPVLFETICSMIYNGQFRELDAEVQAWKEDWICTSYVVTLLCDELTRISNGRLGIITSEDQ